jgi:hypothetical protein
MDISMDERRGIPSASGIERLVLCPGSWLLEQSMPPVEEVSRPALEGTMLHAVLAGGRGLEGLTDRQLWIVERCRALAEDLSEQLGFAGAGVEARTLVEERLWYMFDDGQPAFSGQMDVAIIEGVRGLVIDYKTGTGPVTPTWENYQMRSQAVLLARSFDLSEVYVSIVQPMADHPVSVALYGPEDLRLAELEMLASLRIAHHQNAERIVGDRQCRYCRAKGVCPEVQSHAMTIVPPEMLSITPGPAGRPVLPELSAGELEELLPKIEIAESVIREVKRQAKVLLEREPDAIDGYRLKPGGERRTILDAQEAYSRIADIISPERFAACCSIQIGKLEAAFREATGATARAARVQLDSLLGETLQRKQSEPSIERIDDETPPSESEPRD